MTIHPIQKAQIALLVANEVIIPAEYLDYTNVFLKKSVVEFPVHSDIKEHLINLEPGK